MVGRLGVGPQVTELYERYQHEMEEQHLERLEREWQEEAGKLTVTSVEDVQRVLARAPSHRVMHQMQQTLTTKMQDFLDKEKRKQEEQQRQLLDGYQKRYSRICNAWWTPLRARCSPPSRTNHWRPHSSCSWA